MRTTTGMPAPDGGSHIDEESEPEHALPQVANNMADTLRKQVAGLGKPG